MSAKNREQQQLQESRFLRRALVLLMIILIFLGVAIWRLPSQFLIHTAPDMTKAFVQKAGEVPNYAVYGFARNLWESINYCEEDCSLEYEAKVNQYRNYLTKTCRHDLLTHFQRRQTSYTYRSRVLLPTENTIFRPELVKQVSNDSWFVKVEYVLKDDVKSIDVRNNKMLYPLKIIRSSKPLSVNPIGLEADCYFGEGPVLLEANTEDYS